MKDDVHLYIFIFNIFMIIRVRLDVFQFFFQFFISKFILSIPKQNQPSF